MPPAPHRTRSVLARPGAERAALALLACAALSCWTLVDDDCRLKGACPDDVARMFREAVSPDCAACLEEGCHAKTAECSVSYTCVRAVECLLKRDPQSYQDCLTDLLAKDASTPNDTRGAWEGNLGTFNDCLSKCVTRCRRNKSDWSCVDAGESSSESVDITAVVSVQLFGAEKSRAYPGVPGVAVSHCVAGSCSLGGTTNQDGVAEFPIGGFSRGVYFELVGSDPLLAFPRTFFYPGRLGTEERQPIAIYLVSTLDVTRTNGGLFARSEVLPDAAQSLILPDACREQDSPAAKEVTLHVRTADVAVQRCLPRSETGENPALPCIWYGGTQSPFLDINATLANGWGAGIAGLATGSYNISVCDQQTGELVAYRAGVWMEAGAMTIARTWPLMNDEKREAEAEQAKYGDPCAPQASSSPMIPDASAN